MIESHEEKLYKLFNQAIYIYLISCWIESSFWVELLNQASQLNLSSWIQLLNSTQHFFQKNFNSIQHFSSQVLDLNSSTRLDTISLCLLSLKSLLNLQSLLSSTNSLSLESSETAREMCDCILTFSNIWSICFCRFLTSVSSVIIIWDRCVFRVRDLRCS